MSGHVQDFEPVVLRRAPTKQEAQRDGRVGIVSRRDPEAAHYAKMDSEEAPKPKTLDAECRKELVRARVAAVPKLTQELLNRELSMPANMIRDIESGRAHPTPAQLTALNRKLGLKMHYTKPAVVESSSAPASASVATTTSKPKK